MVELDPALPAYERALQVGTIALALLAALSWLCPLVFSGHEESIVHSFRLAWLIVGLGIAWCAMAILSLVLLFFTAGLAWHRRAMTGVLLLVLIASSAVAWPMIQRYSLVGVAFLGGADYWVSKAAEAKSDEEAVRMIGIIIAAEDMHGGAIACNSIRSHCTPSTQKRLLTLLSSHPLLTSRWDWRPFFRNALEVLEEKENETRQSTTAEP